MSYKQSKINYFGQSYGHVINHILLSVFELEKLKFKVVLGVKIKTSITRKLNFGNNYGILSRNPAIFV